MEKIVPSITRKTSFSEQVCELVFGVDIFDLNLWIQFDSVKQPVKSNSVASGYVSHCWTSALDEHVNHCFVIFKNVENRTELRRIHCLRKHNRRCLIQDYRPELESWFGCGCAC